MGNWNINIQGVGCHHNKDYPKDANKMAREFVESLLAAGHHIEHAEFTHGGKEALPETPAPDECADEPMRPYAVAKQGMVSALDRLAAGMIFDKA